MKFVKALRMTRQKYNDFRGLALPSDEDGTDKGYLVKHQDDEGCISWYPKEQFDKEYRHCKNLTFGLAIESLKLGNKVSRAGWNGKSMFIFLVHRPPLLGIYPNVEEVNYNPHIDMMTANKHVVPWTCSQSDMLADDWYIVD
jgi:hypothetical protein